VARKFQIIRFSWAIRNVFTVGQTVKSISLHFYFIAFEKFQKEQFNKDRSEQKCISNIRHISKYKILYPFHKPTMGMYKQITARMFMESTEIVFYCIISFIGK
jgi:hypothetical protein